MKGIKCPKCGGELPKEALEKAVIEYLSKREELKGDRVAKDKERVIKEVKAELERNRKLLEHYDSIPNGWFGASAIRIGIKAGEEALILDERVKMVQALSLLRVNIRR